MNADLQARIAAIRAECEKVIELNAKLDPWKWKTRKQYIGDGHEVYPLVGNKRKPEDIGEWSSVAACEHQDKKDFHNARFIAHSRNVSPAMARVIVMAIRYAEDTDDKILLLGIANQWEGE